MRAAQSDYRNTIASRALDRELHRLVGDRLTHSTLAVDDQQRAAVGHDRNALIELKLARFQRAHVREHHADAVRVVAGQIGADQVVGDELCFVRR